MNCALVIMYIKVGQFVLQTKQARNKTKLITLVDIFVFTKKISKNSYFFWVSYSAHIFICFGEIFCGHKHP